MKRRIVGYLAAMTMCVSFAVFTSAQDNNRVASAAGDMYVISAKAGGINFVEGKVAVARKNSRSGYLVKGDRLEVGDKVSTGANGKTEILLNPGSFVRLGENAVFEFASTNLDDVKVNLAGGSAIFEVFADDEFRVAIVTPKAEFYAVKTGVYRVDVMPDGSGKISVWKGKAQIGEDEQAVVKGGKAAIVNKNQVAVEKFDRDDKDSLEVWSKSRAKELAKINSRLQRDNVRNSLLSSFNNRGWGLYDSFGLWVFDRFSGYYSFLPFGYGWSSPYGYGYNRCLWNFNMPRYVYSQPQVGNPQNTSGGNQTVSDNPRNSVKAPPFERVERSVERRIPVTFDDMLSPSAGRSSAPPSGGAVVSAPVSVPRTSNKGNPQ